MAKLTELFKAIENKRILANETFDGLFAVLVRVGVDYDSDECIYNNYDIQAVVADVDGNVKTSTVLKAWPFSREWEIEECLSLSVSAVEDGVRVVINYFDKEEGEYIYHTETL